VVDRVLVLERGDDALLIGSADRGAPIVAWLLRHIIADDVELLDVTAETGLVTVLGASAPRVLAERFGVDAAALAPGEHRRAAAPFAGVTIARAEDVGGRSFHVVAPDAEMRAVDAALAELPAAPAETYRALRIEAGVPAFGEEFTERTIPLELRAKDAISFTKGCYVGQEVIARLHNFRRVKRALVRLRVEGDAPPAPGAELLDGEEPVGSVASATSAGGAAVALGFVSVGREQPGRRLTLRDGGVRREVEVLPLTPSGDPS
jgi:folate-binding protein YgfZ